MQNGRNTGLSGLTASTSNLLPEQTYGSNLPIRCVEYFHFLKQINNQIMNNNKLSQQKTKKYELIKLFSGFERVFQKRK